MKELRTGYTTGSCAAAAAKAAALLLTEGTSVREVDIELPGGKRVVIPVASAGRRGAGAEAAVRKDGGDDPDVTHGVVILAYLEPQSPPDILFAAGEGVGRITKPGLSVPPGEPAINPVPRWMISQALREITSQGLVVTLSIPEGRKIAEKTFNPRLGIEGGLSILGTTGIVRPFSVSALRASLVCSLDVAEACGVKEPVFVPGHIGRRAAESHFPVRGEQVVEVGNEWGFIIDSAARRDFESILLVGHPGKLAKLAAGYWDTHSSRSESALTFVIRRAEATLPRLSSGQVTVEGVFTSLALPEIHRLGNVLAEDVRRAIAERAGGGFPRGIAVALTDMKGMILGVAGDFTPWR